MTVAELAAQYPRLFHVTEPGSWPSIRQHGLLSTEMLLRQAGCAEAEVAARIRRLRPSPEVVKSERFGPVVLNDNSPLHEKKLAGCLEGGLRPADWIAMLNQRVFFWVDEKRCHGLRDAKAGSGKRPREVLVFDTGSLLARHTNSVEIAPFNTGNTLYDPVKRGRTTFTPLGEMSFAEWRLRRVREGVKASPDVIVEIVVRDGIPDIAEHLIERREAVIA